MLLISNLFLLLVNAVTLRREFSILFNRVAIFILLYSGIIGYESLYVTYLDTGIGIYHGLFHSTAITHSFDLFIYIIAPIILLLTAFYARRIVQPIFPHNRFEPKKWILLKRLCESIPKCSNVYICYYIAILLYLFHSTSLEFTDYFSDYLALITPVMAYSNADTQKETIVKGNKGKSGVYR